MNKCLLTRSVLTYLVSLTGVSHRIQAGGQLQMLSAPSSLGVDRPVSPLIRGSDGAFYGVADYLFKLQPDGSGFQKLCPCGAGPTPYSPQSALLEASDQALYSVTSDGVFSIRKDGTGYIQIYNFGSDSDSVLSLPNGGLIEGPDGALYLTSQDGGVPNPDSTVILGNGAVFKLMKDGTGFQILHRFGASSDDGQHPIAGLLLANNGLLYGMTPMGGTNGGGVIFSLHTDGSGYRVLHQFGLPPDGANPQGPLMQGRDGWLYGATAKGGVATNTDCNCRGTVFKLQTDGSGYRILHTFGEAGDGLWPYAGLIQARGGALYGTTLFNVASADDGMLQGYGSIFRLNPDGSNYSVLASFDISGPAVYPMAGLVEGNDGALYGTGSGNTIGGYAIGEFYQGSLFKLWPPETPQGNRVTSVGNRVQLTFTGLSGQSYEVLRSLDLVHWNVLTNIVMPPTGAYFHVDEVSPSLRAFYRSAWIP